LHWKKSDSRIATTRMDLYIGIVMGNPGVFQGYPDPDLVKTCTRSLGMGFTGSGYGYPLGCIDMSWVGQV